MSEVERVVVTTVVAAPPDRAFALFTDEVDRWWRREPRFRFDAGDEGRMAFEGGAGGRLVERRADGSLAFEVGQIAIWDPPHRLVVGWRDPSYGDAEPTEIEVRFVAHPWGTQVTLEHRGWDRIGPDHPARRGMRGTALHGVIGTFWGDILTVLQRRSATDKFDSD